MSVLQGDWQTTRLTIRERTTFMLNNHLFSDVKFVVRGSDGESESRQVISAHKFVLSIGSPVFGAMFYGELAERRDSIELPDCERESLLEFCRYIYSDDVNLSGCNVVGVLYLAKKHIVPSLSDKCMGFLQHNLDPSNVLNIIPAAEAYGEKNLVDQCWKVIAEQTETVVNSDAFAVIERSLLDALVERRNSLEITDIDLFKGIVKWAKKESEKRGIVADGKELRRIIGEQTIKEMHFPVMNQKEFISVLLNHKIPS